jgi:cytochrome P450
LSARREAAGTEFGIEETIMEQLAKIEDFTDSFDPFTAFYTTGGEGTMTTPLEQLAALGKKSPVVEADLHEAVGLRAQPNVAELGLRSYLLLTFQTCSDALLNGPVFGSSINEKHIGMTFGSSITSMDAPIHGKYRRLFQAAFTPKALGAYRERFEKVVEHLVGGLMKGNEADLVENFALQFPFSFIYSLLDLPQSDRRIFHKLSAAQTCVVFDRAHGVEAGQKLGRYLSALAEERRKLQSDTDFVSLLANAEVGGERLPEDVLLGFLRQLMNAGGDTSYHGFSNILSALFTQPEQLKLVREDRTLLPQVIEEGLRWGAPLTTVDRVVDQDTIMSGVPMKKGAIVRVCIGAANRDESVWENPHKFDIMRERKRHLAFGYGAHVCIGQHLARMELQIALNALLDRLPNVRLNPDMPPPTIRGLLFRGADAVHVKWDA